MILLKPSVCGDAGQDREGLKGHGIAVGLSRIGGLLTHLGNNGQHGRSMIGLHHGHGMHHKLMDDTMAGACVLGEG